MEKLESIETIIIEPSSSPPSSTSPQSQNGIIVSKKIKNSKKVIILSNDNEEYEFDELIVDMCKTVKSICKGSSKFKNSLGGWFTVDGECIYHKREDRLLASIYKNTKEEIKIYFTDIRGCILNLVLQFCKFHSTNTSSFLATQYDFDFIEKKQANLCELASASYYLDVKSLVSLTSKEIAAQISQRSSEELRHSFTNLQLIAPRDENFEMAMMSLKRSSKSKFNQAKEKENENEKEKEKINIKEYEKEIKIQEIIKNQNNQNNYFNRNSIINIDDYSLNLKDEEDDNDDEIDPALQEEIDREIAIFKERLDSFNRQIKLPQTPYLTNYY
ncbi:hypothetical protein ACTFIV_004100 [Dictyostelium citrinum]